MIQPVKYKSREPLNSLTGIKSSLGNLRSVISLTYLLYLANNKKENVFYSTANGNAIVLKNEYNQFIKNYLEDNTLDDILNENPLLNSQIESLYVGITLMFGLGKVSFENKALSMTKERTGGNRYPKVINYASNMIMLDLILGSIDDAHKKSFLKSWLKDEHLSNDIELKVSTFLNISIENNLFKLRNGDDDLFFQSEGIYLGLNEDDTVSLESDEKVGPARIFNSMLCEGLVPWLNVRRSEVSYNNDCPFNYNAYSKIVSTSLDIRDIKVDKQNKNGESEVKKLLQIKDESNNTQLNALRTKPFLLLAGISGTGKSRIVRELAFKSCPSYLQDADGTTPGNYCMIEVKPNWHDSSELLGYYSNISKKYIFTKFVKFLVKAMMHPDVPFFVCLDEMNLAPVEQYFAEFLSVLETRKLLKIEDDKYCVVSGNLIKPESFVKTVQKEIGGVQMESKLSPTDKDWFYEFFDKGNMTPEEQSFVDKHTDQTLVQKGLSLPQNVFVIGTVNMDDTTHQFSRKVIDRAMTIEMNGGNLENMFGGSRNLEYLPDDKILTMEHLGARYVSADDVIQNCVRVKTSEETLRFITGKTLEGDIIKDDETLPKKLRDINEILKNTPFQVSYRVLNELVIYLAVLLDEDENNTPIEELAANALDSIMLMKILPRIEGDYEMFNPNGEENKLVRLQKLFAEDTESYRKLDEMIVRLNTTEFTRFWP